jgi:malonate decarboxylase alpha subunit
MLVDLTPRVALVVADKADRDGSLYTGVVVASPTPYLIDPLFTRDPGKSRDENVLMGMMAIAGVYEPNQARRLNHGIGYATPERARKIECS